MPDAVKECRMSIRLSSTQTSETMLQDIMDAFARLDTTQRRASSGKQILAASDDPAGTQQSLNLRQQVSTTEQYNRNLEFARSFMATAESALDSVTTQLRQVRTLAVQGASDTTSPDARQAMVAQLQSILVQFGNIGNSSFGSRFVFAGQRTTAPPMGFNGNSYTYSGGTAQTGDSDINVDISQTEMLTVNVTGDRLFLPIQTAIQNLQKDLSNGASYAIANTDLPAIDAQINAVLSFRADLGAKMSRVQSNRLRNDVETLNAQTNISALEDVDIARAIVDLQTSRTTYQAALQTTARIQPLSLLDFLR